MSQTTIKSYGLINFTKKQYIIVQAVVFASLLALFVTAFFIDLDYYLFGNAIAVISIVAFLEVLETFFMLRKFKQKEAEQ